MDLLERDDVIARLDTLLDGASEGAGRVVLVRGEAGIGKTSVVRAFVEAHRNEAHVLWGGCDDLLAARPLGPVWDMVFEEPGLAEALESDDRNPAFTALYEVLIRSLRPTIVVIEDVHWIDEATLDLIKFLGRRIDRTHSLLVLTYRDEEVSGEHPLRIALGDLPHGLVERIALGPLSREAVAQLARVNARNVWEITGGNPFFVTELIGSAGEPVPTSITEAVRSRVLRLSDLGQELVSLASVVPSRVELAIVEQVFGEVEVAIRECEEAGILQLSGDSLSFRHELARRAVEGDLAEIRRRQLNRTMLEAAESLELDLARRAHHAHQAGDAQAMLRLLPVAARRASDLESHREAVAHLTALQPYLDHMTTEQLADHYDLWARAESLILGGGGQGIIDKAIDLRRKLDDPAALGNSLLVASEIAWDSGKRAEARSLAEEAAEVLEPLGGEELAMAYSRISQWAMLGNEEERTIEFAEKAFACAGLGPSRARVHALNNLGMVRMMHHYPDGITEVEESYRLARELKLLYDQGRAANNLAFGHLTHFRLDLAAPWIEDGLRLAEEAEMSTSEEWLRTELALHQLLSGHWEEAETTAESVLTSDATSERVRLLASNVLAKVLTRRGDPGALAVAREAWERAQPTEDPGWVGMAAVALAEYHWLGRPLDGQLINDIRDVFHRCLEREISSLAGDIALWLMLSGHIEEIPYGTGEPYEWLGMGEWARAAVFFEERGIPYELAVTLSLGDTEARLRALSIADELGALPLASKLRGELQAEGVAGVPRRPQRATRESPLGLTPRQTEVLSLLKEGLSNAEIADRLFVSSRTVDHHVSAILSKLGAESRTDAVEKARRAGSLV